MAVIMIAGVDKAETEQLLGKAIESIKNRGRKLDADIHAAACSALAHVIQHNNPKFINTLYQALPKSARKNAFEKWALEFGNLAKNEGDDKKEARLVYSKGAKHDLQGAIDMPFWEFKNVAEGCEPWKFDNYMAGVLKRLQQEANTGAINPIEAAKAMDCLTALQKSLPNLPKAK
jgi:hypothetical protein